MRTPAPGVGADKMPSVPRKVTASSFQSSCMPPPPPSPDLTLRSLTSSAKPAEDLQMGQDLPKVAQPGSRRV